MSEDYEVLGPAEKHVAGQVRSAIETAKKEAQKLLDALEKIDTDLLDDAMLDSKRKATVIAMVEPLQKLGGYLGQASLTPLLVEVLLKSAAEKV